MYADANQLFGDMALFLLAHGMTAEEVLRLASDHDVPFPDSVREMLAGGLGTPPGGWPEKLQHIVLKDTPVGRSRPGGDLPAVDLRVVRAELAEKGAEPGLDEALSSLLYPDVYEDFRDFRRRYGDVSVLPTPAFLYGSAAGVEAAAEIEDGRTLLFKYQTLGEPHADGTRSVFFELNGQPRQVRVRDRSLAVRDAARAKADPGEPGQIGAPWPGVVTGLYVEMHLPVAHADRLLTLEAIKLQSTAYAPFDGTVAAISVAPGDEVDAKDLLVTIEPS